MDDFRVPMTDDMLLFKLAKKVVGTGAKVVKGVFSNDLENQDDLILFKLAKKAVGTTAKVGRSIFSDNLDDMYYSDSLFL
jgi:hypothetical protein